MSCPATVSNPVLIPNPMKTLFIFRHAKSSWDDAVMDDHQRPLNKRGKEDAPRMGLLMRKKDLLPDLVLCSTAKRARKTIELAVEAAGYQGEIKFLEELYAAPPSAYLDALSKVSEDHQRVMVVGHNPGLEQLLFLLTGKLEPMPTAALAQVDLPIEKWVHIDEKIHGELIGIWRPKDL